MAFLPIRRPTRLSQPNGDGIDWSNPITNGLLFAFNAATPKREVAFGRLPDADGSSGVTEFVGSFGRAIKGNSGTAGNYRPWTNVTGNTNYTAIAIVNDSVGRGVIRNPFDSDNSNTGGAHRNFQLRFNASDQAEFIAFNTTQSPFTATLSTTTSSSSGISVLVGRVAGSTAQVFLNGIAGGTATITGTPAAIAVGEKLTVGGVANATAFGSPFLGDIYAAYYFGRPLSGAEINSLSANPWQVFL